MYPEFTAIGRLSPEFYENELIAEQAIKNKMRLVLFISDRIN
jgi:hypothetical protein